MNAYKNAIQAKKIVSSLRSDNPDHNLWISVENQLNFILNDFDRLGNFKKSADKEKVSKIILGVQAVREIDAGDEKLADLLCEIDYEYKSLYSIQ